MKDLTDKKRPTQTLLRIGDTIEIKPGKKWWAARVTRDGNILEIYDGQSWIYFTELRADKSGPNAVAKHNYALFLARALAAIAGLEDHVEEDFTVGPDGLHRFKLV